MLPEIGTTVVWIEETADDITGPARPVVCSPTSDNAPAV